MDRPMGMFALQRATVDRSKINHELEQSLPYPYWFSTGRQWRMCIYRQIWCSTSLFSSKRAEDIPHMQSTSAVSYELCDEELEVEKRE